MRVNHKVKGVRNVSLNVGRAMIRAGVAFECDERGEPLKKAAAKTAKTKKKE